MASLAGWRDTGRKLRGEPAQVRADTGESADAEPEVMDVEQVLLLLPPDTTATLAALREAPDSVAQAAVQLLPFGSRSALEDLGVVSRGRVVDDKGHTSLELTTFGYEVIGAAARREDADPEGVQAASAQWDAAIDGR